MIEAPIAEANVCKEGCGRSINALLQSPVPADSVEKHRVACAESGDLNRVQAPFLSGFARLLRCRKDLG